MMVSHREHNGTIRPKLEPELNRLGRSYRATMAELNKAVEHEQGVLKLRYMRKLDQILDRIRGRMAAFGHKPELIEDVIRSLETPPDIVEKEVS